jgi:hypothetical protein
MHLVVGFVRVMFANFLAALYRSLRWNWIGRRVVRLCCNAFTAGAGLDDAAIEVVQGMGADGVRLLKEESERRGERSIAALMLKMLGAAGDV